MKESTFYYLMQESKIESECSDNKGEEYPSAFADKYNTYYQIAHSYVTGLVPAVEKYARKKCAEARIDFEKFRMHHQSFLDLLNVTEQGKRNKEMILRYIWRKSENSICCAEVTWYFENGACVGCEPRLGKLEGDYIISEYNFEDSRWEMSGLER